MSGTVSDGHVNRGELRSGPISGTALVSAATFNNKPARYADVDGLAIFEGDIVLGRVRRSAWTTDFVTSQWGNGCSSQTGGAVAGNKWSRAWAKAAVLATRSTRSPTPSVYGTSRAVRTAIRSCASFGQTSIRHCSIILRNIAGAASDVQILAGAIGALQRQYTELMVAYEAAVQGMWRQDLSRGGAHRQRCAPS